MGPHEVDIKQQGFADVTRRLTLTVGAAFELPISLKVEAVSESVTVSGQAPILEAARSQIASTVSQTEVKNLPMNGRNFLDLALLVPGVSPTNIASTQLFPETSAVPGQGLSVGSQRNFSNNFIVDGLSANDDAAGLSGIPHGVDAVDQFQVVTSGGQAELGRALGGYVNVVTKSGTNALRETYATTFETILSTPPTLCRGMRPQCTSSNTGELGRARGARPHVLLLELRTTQPRSVWPDDDLVGQYGHHQCEVGVRSAIQARKSRPESIQTPWTASIFSAKLDHQVGGRDQLGVRYSLYHVTSDNSRGAGALAAASASAGLDNVDQSIAISNTSDIVPANRQRDARASLSTAI